MAREHNFPQQKAGKPYARQRFGKNCLKVGIVERETELSIWQATVHTRFRDNAFMRSSRGHLGGGDRYSVRTEVSSVQEISVAR
jgi:hypothetical protein